MSTVVLLDLGLPMASEVIEAAHGCYHAVAPPFRAFPLRSIMLYPSSRVKAKRSNAERLGLRGSLVRIEKEYVFVGARRDLAGIRYDPNGPRCGDLDLWSREITICGKAAGRGLSRLGMRLPARWTVTFV